MWDRIVFGCIAAGAGALLGAALALVLMFLVNPHAFNVMLVLFSAVFFFSVGWSRRAAAGEFVGEAIAYGMSFVAAGGHVDLDPRTQARNGSRSSGWLLVVYCMGLVLLAVFT
jgi:hypothetical protein